MGGVSDVVTVGRNFSSGAEKKTQDAAFIRAEWLGNQSEEVGFHL